MLRNSMLNISNFNIAFNKIVWHGYDLHEVKHIFINITDPKSLYLLLKLKPNVSYLDLDYRSVRNNTHLL